MAKFAGKRVVLSGCGGGSDVLGTSVIYAQIKDVAKQVIFFSLTFTSDAILNKTCQKVSRKCWRVDPNNPAIASDPEEKVYFPEARMARVTGVPIYTLSHHATIQEYTEGYQAALQMELGQGGSFWRSIASTLGVGCGGGRNIGEEPAPPLADALVLCDGGCDVLLTGVETGLATPVEDMAHLKAVLPLDIPEKYITALGANVDCGHGVVQAELDRRLDALYNSGSMIFRQPIGLEHTAGAYFAELVLRCSPVCSIVQSLVLAAMQGYRGKFTPEHLKSRIGHNVVPLTEQTCTLFCFHLYSVANEVVYLPRLQPDFDFLQVASEIGEFQAELEH